MLLNIGVLYTKGVTTMFDIRTLNWSEWLLRQPGVGRGSMHVFREAIGYALYAVIAFDGHALVVPGLWQPNTPESLARLQDSLQVRLQEVLNEA